MIFNRQVYSKVFLWHYFLTFCGQLYKSSSLKMFPQPSLFLCHRSVSFTCLRFSFTAISGFPRFTLFLTTRPHAMWNVNKPTPRCHSHTHTHTHTHTHRFVCGVRSCFYFWPVCVLCKSTAPPLECFLVVK